MGRLDAVFDTFSAQRHRGNDAERQARDGLSVQTDLVKTAEITAGRRTSLLQFPKLPQVFIDRRSEARIPYPSPSSLIFLGAKVLAVQCRVGAGADIKHRCQYHHAMVRQRPRCTKNVKGVEGDQAQNA